MSGYHDNRNAKKILNSETFWPLHVFCTMVYNIGTKIALNCEVTKSPWESLKSGTLCHLMFFAQYFVIGGRPIF